MSYVKRCVHMLLVCSAVVALFGHPSSLLGREKVPSPAGWPVHSVAMGSWLSSFGPKNVEMIPEDSPLDFIAAFVDPDIEEVSPPTTARMMFSILESINAKPTLKPCRLMMVVHTASMSEGWEKGEKDIRDLAIVRTHFQNLIQIVLLCEKHHLRHQKTSLPPYPAALVLNAGFFLQLQKQILNGMEHLSMGGSLPVNEALLDALNSELEAEDLFALLESRGWEGKIIPPFENSLAGLVRATNWMLRCLGPHTHFGWSIPFSWSVLISKNLIGKLGFCHQEHPPSFLAFHQCGSLGSLTDRESLPWNVTVWNKAMHYIDEVSQASGLPIVLMNISGAHLPLQDEAFLPSENQISTGVDFFFESSLKKDVSNLNPSLAAHSLFSDTVEEGHSEITVKDYLSEGGQGWKRCHLDDFRGLVAIIWGGYNMVGAIPSATRPCFDDQGVLLKRIREYVNQHTPPPQEKRD